MDQVTNVISYVAALSVATERITEMTKRMPYISSLLSQAQTDPKREDLRIVLVHALAVLVGGFLCSQTPTSVLPPNFHTFWAYLFFGLLASGGSGFWNSALDTLREVKKQKKNLRKTS